MQDYKSRHKQGKVRRQKQCQFSNFSVKFRERYLKTCNVSPVRLVRVNPSPTGSTWWNQNHPIYTGYTLAEASSGSGGGDTRRLSSKIVKRSKHLTGFKQSKFDVKTQYEIDSRIYFDNKRYHGRSYL